MAAILIADDEEMCRDSIQKVLEKEGYLVESAENVDGVLLKLPERKFDLVVCDYRMPGKTGVDLLRELKERSESVPVIVMSAFFDGATETRAMAMGAVDLIKKPIARRDLVDRTAKAIREAKA